MATTNVTRLERRIGTTEPQFRQMFQHQAASIQPRTLRIDARVLLDGVDDEAQRNAVLRLGGAGVWWTEGEGAQIPWFGGAALKIVCGSHPGIRRTIYADLRPGEYALPPCEHFEISAAYWTPDSDVSGDYGLDALGTSLLEVSAEVAEGETGEVSPLLVSATRRIDTGSICAVPPGAYAFEVYADTAFRARCGAVTVVRIPGERWEPPTMPHPIVGPFAHFVEVYSLDESVGEWSPVIVFWVR